MIEPAWGLGAGDLAGIAELERRVVAHDGGRLKLEWGRLRTRDPAASTDVLAVEDGRIVGFAGLYGPSATSVEIAGMVDPDHRRRGLGTRLLESARELTPTAPLLIVPRDSAGGRALAERAGGRLEHSEHALALRGAPTDGPSDPALELRDARRDDVAALTRLFTDGFGWAPPDLAERFGEPGVRTVVIERDGAVVGTMRVNRDGDTAAVYGFAVDSRHRGRGIGRDALRRVCRDARASGAEVVRLEVEVDNDRALGLYTSLGFAPVVTEDYWRLEGRS